MSDTQWPRYQVFEQHRPDMPHENAGSVHAPDAEMALLNARDVFVRRPHCVSLWVVPDRAIFSKTRQELEVERGEQLSALPASMPAQSYHVFQKLKEQGTHIHAGTVTAVSPLEALHLARQTFAETDPLVWWVFPAASVTESNSDDIESMFAPAQDKIFREQSYYHTVSLMRKIKQKDQNL